MSLLMAELKKCKEKIDDFLLNNVLKRREPTLLFDAASHLIAAGGKRLRPFIAMKCCELVGGDEDLVLPFAAAIEVLHNFTLIHDDIFDQSDKRRGTTTVHKIWGVPHAILAGDFLFAKVFDIIAECSLRSKAYELGVKVLNCLSKATSAICYGQVYDMNVKETEIMSKERYYRTIGLKTASLYKASAEIGGIVGGASDTQLNLLRDYGWNMGIAFQMRDDILGLIGDEATLKKPVGDDIREGKWTLPLIYTMKKAAENERGIIRNVVGNSKASRKDVLKVVELIKKHNGIEYTKKEATKFIERAKKCLLSFPDNKARQVLLELLNFIIVREY